MTAITLNLPSNESYFLDRRLLAYCSPFSSLIIRVRAVWNSTAVNQKRDLTQDELERSTRDVLKWMVGGLVVLTYSSYFTMPLYFKYITAISYTASSILTIYEQLDLRIFNYHFLAAQEIA